VTGLWGASALRALSLLLVAGLAVNTAHAQGVRERTRTPGAGETAVSESQAIELTLTVIEASRRPLQTWVRAAGALDESGRVLRGPVSVREAALLRVGQRVRVFSPESKSRMTQARVTGVTTRGSQAQVEVTLPDRPSYDALRYVMEIIVERGSFLAVSNEAIIEEGDRQTVYLQQEQGRYLPREIHTGLKGELYTEVVGGLAEGDRVVTFGSFFIDAEHKLKMPEQVAPDHARLDH
jgi:hypothetical protein